MSAKEFKAIGGLANNETTQNIITQAITSNSATTIDTVSLASFYSIKYDITIVQGSKVRTSTLSVQTDGTSVDSTEYGIVTTGGAISGVAVTTSISGGNMLLQITITDAASTIARVRSIKNITGVIQPYLPAAPTIGTITGATGTISIPFTAPADNGLSNITSYTATSNPSGYNATGSSSPLTATGIPIGTSFNYTVTATNGIGTGSASSSSNTISIADSSWIGKYSGAMGSSNGSSSGYCSVNKTTGSLIYNQNGDYGGSYHSGIITANPPAVLYYYKAMNNAGGNSGWYKYAWDSLVDNSNNAYHAVTSYNGAGTYSSGLFKIGSNGAYSTGMVFSTTNMFGLQSDINHSVLDSSYIYLSTAGATTPGVMKIPLALNAITWQKSFSGCSGKTYYSGVDTNGNVYSVSQTSNTNPIIVKLNSSGNLVWKKSLTTESGTNPFSATVSKNGTTYILTYSASGYQPVVTKINSDGTYGWTKLINKGNTNQNWPRTIFTDAQDNVYVGIQTQNSIVKLSSSGTLTYARNLSLPNGALGYRISTDDNGAIYFTIMPGPSPWDVYFGKLSGDGAGTGTYLTSVTYSVNSSMSVSNVNYTLTDATGVSVVDSSITYSTGLPTGVGVVSTNYTATPTYTSIS